MCSKSGNRLQVVKLLLKLKWFSVNASNGLYFRNMCFRNTLACRSSTRLKAELNFSSALISERSSFKLMMWVGCAHVSALQYFHLHNVFLCSLLLTRIYIYLLYKAWVFRRVIRLFYQCEQAYEMLKLKVYSSGCQNRELSRPWNLWEFWNRHQYLTLVSTR